MAEDPMARSPMERHIQSGILAVVIALLIWVGNTLTEAGKSLVVLQTQMSTVSSQMAGMYRTADAQRDRADTDRSLTELRQRIGVLEDYHRAERRRP